MDTFTFLKKILPTKGWYFRVEVTSRGAYIHTPFDNIEDLTEAILEADERGVNTIYQACASFREPFIYDEKGKKQWRKKENALCAKAFWIDIDTGQEKVKEGKGYLTQREAAQTLSDFCRDAGFPLPMMVSSGHGLHCYWVLEEDLAIAEWTLLATNLHQIFDRYGLRADTSATKDSVRVLRPVGTTNRKPNKEDKAVRLLKDAAPISIEKMTEIIERNMDELGILSEAQVADINSELTGHTPYDGVSIPSSAVEIAAKCQQIKVLADTQGDVSYEIWRAGIGLTKFCSEGIEIAETWTERRAENHDKTDYQREWDTWESGPPTCGHFETHNRKGCDGCPHKDKIKSPIVLGRTVLDMSERANEDGEVSVEVKAADVTIPVTIPALPPSYDWRDGVMVASEPNPEEEKIDYIPFSDTLFYAVDRIEKVDKTITMLLRAQFPLEGFRDFFLDAVTLQPGSDALKILASQQIIPMRSKKAGSKMVAYLQDWLKKLTNEKPLRYTVRQFGWDENLETFTIGRRNYSPDGNVYDTLPDPTIDTQLINFPEPTGDIDVWTRVVDEIYNHPNELHRQYAIGNAFGSTLTPLCSDRMFKGIIFAITGSETAKGKTTTAQTALTAFGKPDGLTLGGKRGATDNARYQIMSVYNNLPILVDDITHMDANEISDFCYTVSMGTGRKRLKNTQGSGTQLAESIYWGMSPFVTANNDLHGLLAGHKSNTAAEAVRMVEIYIDEHEYTAKELADMNERTRLLDKNQGVAGDLFIRYVVSNREEVSRIMFEWSRRLNDVIKDSRLRHFRSHAECTMSALEICHKLGIVKFDIEAVFNYAVNLINRMAADVSANHQTSAEDAVGQMINDVAAYSVLTPTYKDSRHSMPDKATVQNGKLYGRVIIGDGDKSDPLAGKLFISVKYIREWCNENRMVPEVLFSEMRRLGLWIDLKNDKFVLGRGTTMPTGQTRVICVDYIRMHQLYETEFDAKERERREREQAEKEASRQNKGGKVVQMRKEG